MTEIPIACTLSGTDRTTRGDEWRQFLVTYVVEVTRIESSARLRLKDGDDVLLTAVDLARREKECCAFFEFSLELLPDAVWLDVRVPAEATTMLDALVDIGMT
jgi:hypothetical protein